MVFGEAWPSNPNWLAAGSARSCRQCSEVSALTTESPGSFRSALVWQPLGQTVAYCPLLGSTEEPHSSAFLDQPEQVQSRFLACKLYGMKERRPLATLGDPKAPAGSGGS